MMERLRALGKRWKWLGVALDVQKRFGELNGGYLASAVTLAAFVSIFPLLLVGIAVLGFISGGSPDLADDLVRELGIPRGSDTEQMLIDAIESAEKSRGTASVIGLVGLLWSGLGIVAALQYACDSVWQVTGRGLRDKAVGLLWLAGAGLIFAASIGLTAVLRFLPPVFAPLGVAIGLAVNIGLFLWTFKVLPNRNVGWRAHLPGAVLAAIGFEVLKALGSVLVPRLADSSAVYGAIGGVFAILAWLFFFGRLIVYSAVLNVVLWEHSHGTVTVDVEVPRVPGEVPLGGTRAGDIDPSQVATPS